MDAQHLKPCRKLTAFMDLRQLLSTGLHIWHLHLLLCFQHHFVDALQQPALPVATLLLYSSIIEQRKHVLLKSLQKSFKTVHIKQWFGLGRLFSVIPFQALLITLWKHRRFQKNTSSMGPLLMQVPLRPLSVSGYSGPEVHAWTFHIKMCCTLFTLFVTNLYSPASLLGPSVQLALNTNIYSNGFYSTTGM